MDGSTKSYEAGVCMDEGGDFCSRVAKHHTELAGRSTVIVAIGMIRVLDLAAYIAIEVVSDATNRTVVN